MFLYLSSPVIYFLRRIIHPYKVYQNCPLVYLFNNDRLITEKVATVQLSDSKTSISNSSIKKWKYVMQIKRTLIISMTMLLSVLSALYITLNVQQRSKIPSASITNRKTSFENIEERCFKN